MVVETIKTGNVTVRIYDDYISADNVPEMMAVAKKIVTAVYKRRLLEEGLQKPGLVKSEGDTTL